MNKVSKPFQFKKFSVAQDKTAMKIGTDGVLLGSWVSMPNTTQSNCLDIGTGTGVIALMLAQRFNNASIDALDIDKDAFLQAKANFECSDWSDRLNAFNTALKEFFSNKKYNLIVCNPPFFQSVQTVSTAREQARQRASLPFAILLQHSKRLLDYSGELAVIIPYESQDEFCELAVKQNLFPYKRTRVYGTKNSRPKRVLIQFAQTKQRIDETDLVLEIARHQYTDEYIALVKDFYLKL